MNLRWRCDVFYKFKKARDGVALGMFVNAHTEEEAAEKAKAKCIGPKWPSRIWVATNCRLEGTAP